MTRMIAAAASAIVLLVQPALAEEKEYDNSVTYAGPDAGVGPGWVPEGGWTMPAPPLDPDRAANQITPDVITAEAKMKMMQSTMMGNPMSLRQMINMMVAKKKADSSLSFDEVIESMDLRANFLNMKKVGHNTPHKVIEAITGETSPRLEMVSYCDVMTMRDILDYVPEFGAFVPCRITVLEDNNGDIWLMTLDWDVRWLDTSPNPNKISPELREGAIKIREALEEIMEAGANGDL
ncbi:DUF302 domain-containing protein [Marimonas lutisalis]|uniref:DUF302 domain-containing protein n=1 Tax=Marimonas lutisalis TaxID=2545756 RepID=UPI001375E276|nr:DUF302 domain-containing protein [Marimonas lutisalis]